VGLVPRAKRGLMAKKKYKGRGITNKQAAYLAALKRDLGEKYDGNGKSCAWASREIDRCLKDLGWTPEVRTAAAELRSGMNLALDRDSS